MKVLVVGSGGREHAICYAFSRSQRVKQVYCANGNAGIESVAECLDIKPTDIDGLASFAAAGGMDLTFVGGETALAMGIADEFRQRGLPIIGPGKAAARLESSKAFAKDFMVRHGVPTAEYAAADSIDSTLEILRGGRFGGEDAPVVVKADGLAAGKGVVMAEDRSQAIEAINGMAELVGDEAASSIVLEERLTGKEVSLLMFVDGEDFALMPPTRDHKRIGEGDTGPNTGGMGTITDASFLTNDQLDEIAEKMIKPTLRGCIDEGMPFRGILFLGLMMTEAGPRLLEYNVRFGDPETQAILVRLDSDLADICEAMLSGDLGKTDVRWKPGSSACIVLASRGYPSAPAVGDVIHGIEKATAMPDIEIFHAGTAHDAAGRFITAGGRVLGVTAIGRNLEDARAKAYAAASEITFEGMQIRLDIGRA